jgi:hypothetical protein
MLKECRRAGKEKGAGEQLTLRTDDARRSGPENARL